MESDCCPVVTNDFRHPHAVPGGVDSRVLQGVGGETRVALRVQFDACVVHVDGTSNTGQHHLMRREGAVSNIKDKT